MAVALLDVNVLLALAWPTHFHHAAAHRWFAAQRKKRWATTTSTQLGFLRLSVQPAVVKVSVSFRDACSALESSMSAHEHEFWPVDYPVSDMLPEIRSRVMGHQQVSDALLLDLAIRKSGKLATFDQRIRVLLPPASPHQRAIELIAPDE
jgi:toxin-antitoxin system PIN domain toxin